MTVSQASESPNISSNDAFPQSWRMTRLGHVVWLRARLGWKGLKADEYVPEGYPLLSTPDIKGKYIEFENVNFVSKVRFDESPEIKLCLGDVLLAKDGSTLGTVNVVRELPREATVNSSIAVLTPSKEIHSLFLYYSLQSSVLVSLIQELKGGMGVPHLFQDDIKRFPLALPPLDEQRQIAEYLDQETDKIDELITKQEQLVVTLAERRLAVVLRAVTRGLRQDQVMRPSGIDWLGDVPTSWTVKRIKDSVYLAKNGVWGDEPDGGADDIWCVRVADFDRPALSVSQLDKTIRNVRRSERNGRILKRGDLILEKSGGGEKSPVGFVAIYDYDEPAVCSNFVARVQLKPGQDARYWLYLHAAAYGTRLSQRSIKQTSGIQNLDQSSYFNEKVAFPPPDEQVSIVEHIDEVLTQINSVVSKTRRSVALLRERRAALISAAVTGKIDVRGL